METIPDIRIQSPDGEARFAPGTLVRIGRRANLDVVIDNPNVSRMHAVLKSDSGIWTLEDVASTQGLFIDDQQIHSVAIVDKSLTIQFGKPGLGTALTFTPMGPSVVDGNLVVGDQDATLIVAPVQASSPMPPAPAPPNAPTMASTSPETPSPLPVVPSPPAPPGPPTDPLPTPPIAEEIPAVPDTSPLLEATELEPQVLAPVAPPLLSDITEMTSVSVTQTDEATATHESAIADRTQAEIALAQLFGTASNFPQMENLLEASLPADKHIDLPDPVHYDTSETADTATPEAVEQPLAESEPQVVAPERPRNTAKKKTPKKTSAAPIAINDGASDDSPQKVQRDPSITIEHASGAYTSTGRNAIVIGSDETCDVVINSARVSKRHAVIRHTDGGWVLDDLKSNHGTLVGFLPVTTKLINGDIDAWLGGPTAGAKITIRLVE